MPSVAIKVVAGNKGDRLRQLGPLTHMTVFFQGDHFVSSAGDRRLPPGSVRVRQAQVVNWRRYPPAAPHLDLMQDQRATVRGCGDVNPYLACCLADGHIQGFQTVTTACRRSTSARSMIPTPSSVSVLSRRAKR